MRSVVNIARRMSCRVRDLAPLVFYFVDGSRIIDKDTNNTSKTEMYTNSYDKARGHNSSDDSDQSLMRDELVTQTCDAFHEPHAVSRAQSWTRSENVWVLPGLWAQDVVGCWNRRSQKLSKLEAEGSFQMCGSAIISLDSSISWASY